MNDDEDNASPSGQQAADDLTRALGTTPPAGILALGDDVIADLAAAVAAARQTQLDQLGDAFEHALRVVPRPLRRVVRKVVEG